MLLCACAAVEPRILHHEFDLANFFLDLLDVHFSPPTRDEP